MRSLLLVVFVIGAWSCGGRSLDDDGSPARLEQTPSEDPSAPPGKEPGGCYFRPSCDVGVALFQSCGSIGCHGALDFKAGLSFWDLGFSVMSLRDVPARHRDIDCAAPGMPFRECRSSELPAGCSSNDMLLDTTAPDDSWLIKKIRGDASCGHPMPIPPSDSAANGWSEARRQCLDDYFFWSAIRNPTCDDGSY